MALIFDIKVAPSAGKQEIKLDKNGSLKCLLRSNPEKGKANAELIRFLADRLNIDRALVTLISGQTSRNKRIKIDLSITQEALLDMLGIQKQKTIFDL